MAALTPRLTSGLPRLRRGEAAWPQPGLALGLALALTLALTLTRALARAEPEPYAGYGAVERAAGWGRSTLPIALQRVGRRRSRTRRTRRMETHIDMPGLRVGRNQALVPTFSLPDPCERAGVTVAASLTLP